MWSLTMSKGSGRPVPVPRWIATLPTLLPCLLCLLLLAPGVEAQQQLGGRVLQAGTGQPVVAAQVMIQGTSQGTLTDSRGQFVLQGVSGASVTVRVISLGYREVSQTLEVGRLDHVIQMTVSAISLDEVVVTGTAGGQQQRALGNVVGRVAVAEMQQLQPASDVSDMLSANVPGVRIMATGGEVGAGGIQRIRGVSSVSLGGSPLVYVDGVRVSGGNAVSGVGSVGFVRGRPSPIDDIAPESIESIEVIKGPAAATLYGTEASNGVINIITKQGAIGAPRIDMRLRQGAYWLPDPINFFPPTYYRCTGSSSTVDVDPRLQCDPGEIVEVNILRLEKELYGNEWFRTGTMPGIGADISGGAGTLRYFFSGDFERDEGYVSYNYRDRLNGRANLSYAPSETFSIDFNLGTVRSTAQSASPQQPITTSIIWACPSPTCEAGSGAGSRLDGPMRGFIGYLPERFEEDIEGFQFTDRTTGGLTFTHRPTDWFTHRLVAGADFSNLRNTLLFRGGNKPGMINRAGRRDVGNTRLSYASLDYGASVPLQLTSSLSATTSAGAQFYRRVNETSLARGDQFPLDVLETVSSGGTRTGFEEYWENRSFGMYLQEELSWQNRIFLTAAVRGDDNSAFGENFSFVVYPKLSASWVLGEEAFLRDREWLSTLRVRGAWGRAGTQPDVFDAVRTYEPVTGIDGQAVITPENVGNPDLKPEVGDEIEVGLDASFFNERLSLEFTHFRQRTLDALIRVPTLPSLGFPGFQFQNLGETKNSGIEIALTGNVFRGDRAKLDLGITLASAKNEIVSLGSEDFVIQNVGDGQYQVPGFPIGGIFNKRVVSADIVQRNWPLRNTATNIMCEGGERIGNTSFSRGGGAPVPCAQAPRIYWGQPLPVWEGGFNANLTIGENLTLFGLVDFIQGRTWINADIRGANHSFFNTRGVVEGVDPILLSYLALGTDGRAQTGIMSGDFAKLRTVSVQYRLPAAWAGRVGASRMSLNVSGDNLAILWMGARENFGHRSMDPERGAQGGGQTPGINATFQEGWPMGRKITTTLRVTF